MNNFCSNCGRELKHGQQVCLGCGKNLEIDSNLQNPIIDEKIKSTKYNKIVSIISIVLCSCFFIAYLDDPNQDNFMLLGLPGIFGFISGILQLNVKNDKKYSLYAGLLLLVSAIINFLQLGDVSLWAIYAVVFGIINIVKMSNN